MQRIQYVDRLKGFAMLAVIFGHIYFFFIYDKEFYIAYFLSTFHMPLFMFLSGWVISSPPNFSKLLVKIASFVSPFLFVGSAFVLFYHKELSTLFESEVKNGYWYLFVLSILYIFYIHIMQSIILSNSNGMILFGPY